jgi:hypothetical protein
MARSPGCAERGLALAAVHVRNERAVAGGAASFMVASRPDPPSKGVNASRRHNALRVRAATALGLPDVLVRALKD